MRQRRIGMSRRDFMTFSALTSAGFSLAACGRRPSSSDEEQLVQLVYQDWRTEWFPLMAQEMLEQFHNEYPGIRVFYTPDPEDFIDQMAQDFRSGSAPDVFQGCCTHFPSWAQEGYTLDLAPFMDERLSVETRRDWDPAQLDALRLDNGHQFGLPKYHGALGLYFNKDLFDEYGVDYPDESWDFDDYSQAMGLLTDDRDADGEIDQWGSAIDVSWDRIQVHVNSWGGHLVDPQNPTISRMAEGPARSALRWLHERIQVDQVLATPFHLQNLSLEDAFIQRRTAMIESGSWSLKAVLAQAPFRVGVAPFPHGPARRVTLATTDGFGIFAGTRYPEAAWELMEFLISPEYGLAMAEANLLQPARKSLVDDWVRLVQSEYPEKSMGVDVAAFAQGHQQGYSVTAEIFAEMDVARELAYKAWDAILVLDEQPVDHIIEVSNQISQAQVGGP